MLLNILSDLHLGQGALAVRHWTGVEPDRAVMRAAAAPAPVLMTSSMRPSTCQCPVPASR